MPATTESHGSPLRDASVNVKGINSGDAGKAGYKSWKKKYRKMRITFDRKMHDSEELHKQEEKASAIVKRLAIENEYVRPSPSSSLRVIVRTGLSNITQPSSRYSHRSQPPRPDPN